MRKKKEKNEEIHHHHHYATNWNGVIKYLFIGVVCFILIAQISGSIGGKVAENKMVHKNCVDACSKDHHLGIRIGIDGDDSNCIAEEHNPTQCIKHCNLMYLKSKG